MAKTTEKKRRYSGLTYQKAAQHVVEGMNAVEIAEQYGVERITVSGHIRRAVQNGWLIRTGHARYEPGPEFGGAKEGESEPVQIITEPVPVESDILKIGEWILDFDARLRKVETRLADGLEGIADKLGDMQGSMIALRQAHIVTSQSVGGIKEQLEQTRLASPDYTDRLLTILETQQAIMVDMARGRDDGDQS